MSVSIAIPTYNRADLLKRALRSIARQQLKPDCVIVSDNASDDHTEKVVNEFMKSGIRVIYHRQDKNLGMLKNWEHAISLVETKYFLVLADDDYLLPNCLKSGMEVFNTNPGLGMWCGVTVCVDPNLRPIALAPSDLDAVGRLHNFDLLTYMLQHPASTGSIFSREIFDRVGGFRAESGYLADLSIMLRIAAASEIIIVKEPVAIYSASGTYSKGDLFNRWYPGCIDVFEQLKMLGVKESFSYKRYVARTLFLSCMQLKKDILGKTDKLISNYEVFTSLFKYLTPVVPLLAFLEGARLTYHGLKYKFQKSELANYCDLYRIDQKIKEANQ